MNFSFNQKYRLGEPTITIVWSDTRLGLEKARIARIRIERYEPKGKEKRSFRESSERQKQRERAFRFQVYFITKSRSLAAEPRSLRLARE